MERVDESTSIKAAVELKNMAAYGVRGEPKVVEATEPEGNDLVEIELTRLEADTSSEEEDEEEESDGEAKPLWKRLVRKVNKRRKRGKAKGRETWDNKVQFILTLIGYAVGLGNVWRFSYLCAKNGGGAFIIPYMIMLFLLGIPLFYLELLLGQSVRKGPIGAWMKLIPNLAGIGMAAVVVIVYICIYYNVIISWVLFYFVNSFHDPLPWAKCFGYEVHGHNLTKVMIETTVDNFTLARCWNESTEFYWYETALQASDHIGAAERFNWQMFLSLLAAWILIYLCLFKGIQSSGKVVYFSATFPYVVLVCLFFRAVTLEGAGKGIEFLFLPGVDTVTEKLFTPQVWLEAATQIFFSLGVATGSLIALASYNKPRNNALKDSIIVCLTNSFTSVFAGIVVFSIVGFKAQRTGEDVELVAQGPGLAFVVFTEALIRMPLSPLWAVLFFIMLLLLGLDSQFATVEGLITVLMDSRRISKIRKEIVVGVVCLLMFLASFPFVLGNGIYMFQLFDQFAGTIPLLFIGLCEFFAIGWVIGVRRFLEDICKLHPHRYMTRLWTVLWMYVNPITMLVIFLGSIINELVTPLEYTAYQNYDEVQVEYPHWAHFVGSVIVLSSITCIPVFLIGRLIFLETARQQASVFLREKVDQFEYAYTQLKLFSKSLRNWRGVSWERFTNRTSSSLSDTEEIYRHQEEISNGDTH